MDEPLSENQKIREIRDIVDEDISALAQRRENELYAMEMYLGDQWKRVKKKRNKSYLSINMIKGRVDLISGWYRQNKTDLKMAPIGSEDDRKADVYSQLLKYVFANRRFWNTWCECVDDALIMGVGWAHPYIAYDYDVYAGEVCVEHENPLNIIFDPYMTKFDLSDCGRISKSIYLDKNIAKLRWPTHKKDFDKLGERLEQSFYASANRIFEKKSRLNFLEHWYRDSEERTYIYDSAADRMEEFDGDERSTIERLVSLGVDTSNISFIKRRKNIIKMTLSCEDEFILYDGLAPDIEDEYPFIPITGWYTPSYPDWKDKLQGVCWSLHDIQQEKNKRRNQMNEFSFTKNLKGYLKLRSANIDVSQFESGESQFIDTDDMNGLQELNAPKIPEIYSFLEQKSDQDFMVAGPRDLLEASAGHGASSPVGSLNIMQRESLTRVQKVLDNIGTSYEMLGNYVVKLVNKSWPTEIMRKIVGDNFIGAEQRKALQTQMKSLMDTPPSQEKEVAIEQIGAQVKKIESDTEEFWAEFEDTKKDIRYDCRITESAPTPTQRTATLAIFGDLMHQGVQIPPQVWIPYTDLPPQEKEKWLELIQQQAQAAAQQQEQMLQAKMSIEDTKVKAGLAKQDSINASQERIAQSNNKESSNE